MRSVCQFKTRSKTTTSTTPASAAAAATPAATPAPAAITTAAATTATATATTYAAAEKRNYDSYSNEHPIVRTHPETGKKILFVNWTYTKQIIGLDKEESDQILKEIFEHQARLDLTCRFNWTENAVAIWDNRSVIHYAIADFFPGRGLGHERIMDRIAIEGDHPQ